MCGTARVLLNDWLWKFTNLSIYMGIKLTLLSKITAARYAERQTGLNLYIHLSVRMYVCMY